MRGKPEPGYAARPLKLFMLESGMSPKALIASLFVALASLGLTVPDAQAARVKAQHSQAVEKTAKKPSKKASKAAKKKSPAKKKAGSKKKSGKKAGNQSSKRSHA